MDYEGLVERLRNETYWLGGSEPYSHDVHPTICDEAAEVITDLIARVESAEARAEKAERERNTYKIFFDDISKRPDCNTCSKKECEYRPGIGKITRFNCPLWRGHKEE